MSLSNEADSGCSPSVLFEWPTIERWARGDGVALDRLITELRDALEHFTRPPRDALPGRQVDDDEWNTRKGYNDVIPGRLPSSEESS